MRGRRLYGTLTGRADLYAMPRLVERYLRFAGASLCVLAVGACARLAPSDPDAFRPEPRFAEPSGATVEQAATHTDADPMAALEAEMDTLSARAADLQRAIAVMGPLPDPGAGLVYATWPDAAQIPARTTYRQVAQPTVMSKAAAILFPASGDTRLVVSSLPGEGAHDALCVELAALAGRCRPAAPIRAYR
ncbi:MAG TPA: hypothetical protein VFV70_05135 [Hyphomonadaceae bacterium]|nr:hypothetical protein [Hyphomonadaceae bacterium]